ncbi:MAG: WD40 repeat domain-containing protein [Acidobacteriota bacterium]|nr:WD40 repeat domain-containing protein [Acidobacteriota bacterium]MDW3229104.1 WD40 repeat domain-containing protein [Acidobacteriota bacterium]
MSRKKIIGLTLLAILIVVAQLQAVVPKKWELSSKAAFLKGKFSGISLTSEGVLSIGPRVEKIELPAEEFYLSLAKAPDGSFFLGTGHGGKIYRLGKDKKAELYFKTAEMDVTALAVDAKGVLYAGTSPNGKIYKITAKDKGEEFFNPQEKYIWELLLSSKGYLLAAVGESGGIYEINSAGAGKLLFKARDNHILCLHQLSSGDLLAGSGGRGQLYRLSASDRVTVVFDSGYEEIRNIALDREGNIYVSASGVPSKSVSTVTATPGESKVETETEVSVVISDVRLVADEPEIPSTSTVGKSTGKVSGAVFQVTVDGLARKIWSSEEEMVYSLIFDSSSQKLIMGTGNQGRIYSLDRQGTVELLTEESSEQIFKLLQPDKQIQVLGNNPCLFGTLLLGQNFSGEYLGPVLDAKILTTWGRISWQSEQPEGSTIQIQSRSGNTAEPDETWSDWSPPYSRADEKILSPSGRYLQIKINLKSQTGQKLPKVDKILVFYLQSNVAPSIDKLEVLPANQVLIKPPEQEDEILGLDQASRETGKGKNQSRVFLSPRKAERQGFRTITWEASDENEDQLTYDVYIRKDGQSLWSLMQAKMTERVLAFDTRNFPDGTYQLKVEASDLPSNPPGTEKKAEKISQFLVIDNSLPVIKNFTATRTGDSLEISFVAEDAYSYIEEVKFLIKPEEWKVVFPVDGLADSRTENFKFKAKIPADSDNQLIIRVRDSFGNIGVHHQRF